MTRYNKKPILLFLCLAAIYSHLTGQETSVIQYVNPLIGTTNTQTTSLWGSEGGTYPGAVSPFGFIQLTPETRNGDSKGYNYTDNSILYFSCINHPTGYPDGSSGMIHIMPVKEGYSLQNGKYDRLFSHLDEKATPGYYTVLFRDNGTRVEVTAAERSGMFRFTFPPNSKPRVFLGDLGDLQTISKRGLSGTKGHAIISFNSDYTNKEDVPGGCILTFPQVEQGKERLILKIGVSSVDFESTLNNLRFEADDWDFDQFKAQNQGKWNKALSVITVEDSSNSNKTIFYTALYHSMLMPWITSDFLGNYRGADNLIHKTKGKNQYGGFSAWDTFRSLHPLLCLIAPDRQRDMLLSMIDQYEQSGSLPLGPMTGNHVIPIIVDSYLKGIDFDKALAYKAMKSCLAAASGSLDFSAYRQLGYVPASCSESVTKTVEFAYDDWALAKFAGKVMNDQDECTKLLNRSSNYRNLFSPVALALLPRQEKNFNLEPGNSGYKEGDQWSYSLFVPHNPRDLINLTGGDEEFAARQDSALTNQFILFDNEPVLHVPYLFNYANRPDLTQKWVRNLMKTHYTNSPYGLPGNDDHGAMSSWFVFSAMGFYPVCPGKPVYDLGSPIFKKVTIHLQSGKNWIVNSKNNGADQPFVRSTMLNGKALNTGWITHSTIAQGGNLTFEMDKSPLCFRIAPDFAPASETMAIPDFKVTGFYRSQKEVAPDQLFYIPFMVQNKGGKGTKIVRLFADGKEINKKNLLIAENSTAFDSIGCRLYPVGKRVIRIDQLQEHPVEVIQTKIKPSSLSIKIVELACRRINKANTPLEYSFTIQNSGGLNLKTTIPVWADEAVCAEEVVNLEPGEIRKIVKTHTFIKPGIHRLQVGAKTHQIKIYTENCDSYVLDMNPGNQVFKDTVTDQSGLLNRALIHRSDGGLVKSNRGIQTDSVNYAELFKSESLDKLDQKLTVMAWVKPLKGNQMLSDIITKGDFIALQASGDRSLSWFAGGWGRGSCSATVPDNWLNNWHHIAGVADGKILKIYIDGFESGTVLIDQPANLTCTAKWMIGRNEEFPDQRFFNGFVNHFKIFVEPLTEPEIKSEMLKGNPISGL